MRPALRSAARQGRLAAARSASGSALADTLEPPHPPVQSLRVTAKDGDASHTSKWLPQHVPASVRTPAQWIAEVAPIAVHDASARCYGGADPALGHPVEYIALADTSAAHPATCKYCGLRFYAEAHHH